MASRIISDEDLERRVLLRVWLLSALFFAAVGFINASSLVADAERIGYAIQPRAAWIVEYSSVLVLALLTPLVALLERRFPVEPETWRRALAAHLIGSIVFSGLHIAGMTVLRIAAFRLFLDETYRIEPGVVAGMLYEYRKDVLPYAVILLVLTLTRALEEHKREAQAARAEARETGRLTLKSGGRTILLDAKAMEWAQAAGNYAEIRANGTTHLARISLTALEQQLLEAGVDVVRVHRSRIVNRAKVVEIAPARDGDFRIRMRDGSELRGSRRFRPLLPA